MSRWVNFPMSKKKPNPKAETRQIPLGTFCKVKRPNLWQGFHCLIEAHREDCHIIRLTRMDATSFLAAAKLEELEAINHSP